MLSLWSREGFRAEIGEPGTGIAPITLSHNLESAEQVDAALAQAAEAGAEVAAGAHREWGGYSGYFIDPDGFRWEVAHNPQPLSVQLLVATRAWQRR